VGDVAPLAVLALGALCAGFVLKAFHGRMRMNVFDEALIEKSENCRSHRNARPS